MRKIDGCDCEMERTRLVWIVDLLCGILLIGITVWVACRYTALPDKIPTHYGADGVIDGYGNKSAIWILIIIMWFLVGVLSLTELFPRFWNIPFKVTKDNHGQLIKLIWHFISITKLLVASLFVYLIVMCMRGENLLPCFVPMVLAVFGVNSLYWVVRLFRNR